MSEEKSHEVLNLLPLYTLDWRNLSRKVYFYISRDVKILLLPDQRHLFIPGWYEKAWIQGDASFSWCIIVSSEYWFYRPKGCSWKSKFICDVFISIYLIAVLVLDE